MVQKLLGNLTKGLLFVISAPAGTGKSTLVNILKEEFECVVESVSYTTRQPRDDETQGIDYHFISEEEFRQKVDREELLEHANVFGSNYGTSKKFVEEYQQKGKHVILVIDTQGALQLKKKIDAIFIFLCPPTLNELKRRISMRRTETMREIDTRIAWAKEELEAAKYYDYQIINEDLIITYNVLRSILIAEEHRMRG